MDDRTIDLSIMHKIVREMTGTLLVGSVWKQAINLQGNNNDSSQGNKGHPLLPVVINLTHSSIGWKKNASSLTTHGITGRRYFNQPTWYAIISLYRGKNTISSFILAIFLLCLWRWGERVSAVMAGWNSAEQVGIYSRERFPLSLQPSPNPVVTGCTFERDNQTRLHFFKVVIPLNCLFFQKLEEKYSGKSKHEGNAFCLQIVLRSTVKDS